MPGAFYGVELILMAHLACIGAGVGRICGWTRLPRGQLALTNHKKYTTQLSQSGMNAFLAFS
jgi:hypothetical protein